MKNSELQSYTPDMIALKPLNESDFHGASFVLNKLYNRGNPAPIIGTTLKHGWTPNRFIGHHRQVIHWGEKRDVHLCFNRFQEKYLRESGFPQSMFVGAPFLHAQRLISPLGLKKIPSSLLIMPQHSLKHMQGHMLPLDFLKNSLETARTQGFGKVAICLHRQSQDDEIIAFAKKNGIEIIIGASEYDAKTLINQAILMAQFSNIHTNSIGSHVVYGLASNCEIKISNLHTYTFDYLIQHDWYRQHQDVAKIAAERWEKVELLYPELFSREWVTKAQVPGLLEEEMSAIPEIDFDQLFEKFSVKSLRWMVKNHHPYKKFERYVDNDLGP